MNRFKLALHFLIMLMSLQSLCFAEPDDASKTLFTIKLYSEPKDKGRVSTYFITLPEGLSYSSFVGSDLPKWRYVNDRVVEGEFNSVSLVTLRIHPAKIQCIHQKAKQQNLAKITILDPKNARIVWQGMIKHENNHINVKTLIDNKKYFETTVKVDPSTKTVWLETQDK